MDLYQVMFVFYSGMAAGWALHVLFLRVDHCSKCGAKTLCYADHDSYFPSCKNCGKSLP